MNTNWRPDLTAAPGPLYRALADTICAAVAAGEIAPGERLPPVRDLAWRIRVSPGAVARAYRIGIERGALEATVGRGTFARGPAPRGYALDALNAPRPAEKIDLRGNRAVDVGQDADIAAALARLVARNPTVPLTGYREPDDDLPQRGALAAWLRAGGVPAQAEQVVVTAGAQAGVMTCLAALSRGGEGLALTEAVVHPGLKDCAELARVRLEPVACDTEGMTPEALDAACARRRPDAVLLSATLHNPTGATMSPARRAAIVEVARRRDVALIEDDVYGWLLPDRPDSFATLAPERCWYVASFSKCIAAGLRAGMIVAPPGRTLPVLRAHQAMAQHTSWLISALAAELAESGDADRIRERVRVETAARVALAVRLLGRRGAVTHPAASFVSLPTPEPWTSDAFTAAAAERGVLVAPRAAYLVGRATGPDFVRVALGARASRAALETGLARLSQLLDEGPRAAAPIT